jgi:hypothetical protein
MKIDLNFPIVTMFHYGIAKHKHYRVLIIKPIGKKQNQVNDKIDRASLLCASSTTLCFYRATRSRLSYVYTRNRLVVNFAGKRLNFKPNCEALENMWPLTNSVLISAVALCLLQNLPSGAAGGTSAKVAPTTPSMAPARPVMTVHGVCEQGKARATATSDAASCAVVLTRERFEHLVEALNPGGQTLPANARQSLARTYAEYLAIEAAARKAGMEDTPQFGELMSWIRLKTITDLYRRKLQEKYISPSLQEIDAYYQEHQSAYERVKLTRILVPRQSPAGSAQNNDDFDKRAHGAAESARANLVKGLDPTQVQKETFAALSLATPPATDLGARKRSDLLAEEVSDVFSLSVGEVSKVETEPKNYVIYKVTGKDVIPKDQVKKDIAREIYQQNFKDAMKAVLAAAPAEFDEEYLGPANATTPAKSPDTHVPSSEH